MEQRDLVRSIISELRQKKEQKAFQPTPDIDMVWVVSLPGTVSTPSDDGIYQGRMADKEIVDAGVDLVTQITAMRLHKPVKDVSKDDIAQSGPTFFYNGEDRTHGKYAQNEDLQRLVDTPEFPIPPGKVTIRNIEEMNTVGQVKNIAEFLHQNPQFKKIAVVARVHHQRRVARYLEQLRGLLPQDVELLDASVPETQKHVGSTLREVRKIVRYAKKGDLTEEPYF